jgi:hypothetical protein
MVNAPEWHAALERYRWLDRYLSGDEFARFASREEARVRTILDELGVGAGEPGLLAPANAYPTLVLAGLAVCGVALMGRAAVARRRAPRGASVPAPLPRAVWWLAGALVLNLLMAESVGFVVASTAMFWLTARAFDRSHPVRDGLFAAGVSLAAYLLFARLLQLPLP